MTKEMIDTVEKYVRFKLYKANNSMSDIQALLIIHNAIQKIKKRMEDGTNGN